MIPRRRFHRIVFTLAGIYNIAWGLYTSYDPQWLFRFSGMRPALHPEIFMCLAMVVGIYGLLYLECARRPEHNWLPAAVGFAGKILGPLGALYLIGTGTWPMNALVLNLSNDFIWLIPFALYLKDAWPFYRSTWE